MKKGRYYSLGEYSDIKIGFGTIDILNLKSIYLDFNSWICLDEEIESKEVEKKFGLIKKNIKKFIFNNNYGFLKNECIVDFDISYKSLSVEKQTYFNLEITLFLNKIIDLKQEKETFKSISLYIIEQHINTIIPLNFSIFKD